MDKNETSRIIPLLIAALIVIGFVLYANSFGNAFIFDDEPQIINNPKIRTLFPPREIFSNNRRPILYLSLAVNHALGGLKVEGYHFFNLLIHTGSAILLFAIVRRTLLHDRLKKRFEGSAVRLAFAIALLWLAHPVHTQSVTYVIQRAESLMGFFYFLTVYGAIRYLAHPLRRWGWVAVIACALGMATKETMATAPVIVLLHDRIFMASSWREIWQRRKIFYAGLAATWGMVLFLLLVMKPETLPTAGFDYAGISPFHYALTQTGVILHYLKLIVVPSPLAFDYNGWPVAEHLGEVAGPAAGLAALLILLAVTLGKRPRAGFLGLWFFIILLPSSSVMPIADVAFEYRLYLPSAGIVALLVLGLEWGLNALIPRREIVRMTFVVLVALAATTLSWLTVQRNRDYRDEFSIWQDTVTKRPQNPRAHTILGVLYFNQGRWAEAERYYRNALAINPQDAIVHNNLGMLYAEQDQFTGAKDFYRKSLTFNDALAGTVHNNLAVVYLREKDYASTIAECETAIRKGYRDAPVYSNYGIALTRLGRYDEAIPYFQKALTLNPHFPEARRVLDEALAAGGR